jgi:molybdopterin synthase catalytic subunit
MVRVLVQEADFNAGAEIALLGAAGGGAVASFVGVVRSDAANPVTALRLEHYPGMTEGAIDDIVAEAEQRFGLLACTVIHRVGVLPAGAQIVFAGAAAAHRHAALEAVGFLMDWLKTKAPFWKQEFLTGGAARWVEARAADDEVAARW